jgi:sulfur carrier protein
MIVVSVKGKPREVTNGTTLAELVEALGHAVDRVATAIDGEFVPRDARAVHTLQPGAHITCFQAIVGG